MLTLEEADSSGCLMMINPQTDQYKVLHQYQTSHWNGYVQSWFPCVREKSGDFLFFQVQGPARELKQIMEIEK